MSSKRAAIDVEESDSVAKRSHALDHLGVLVTKIGATRKYDETKDHSSEKYDGSQVDGEKDNGFDAEGLARDKRLESATGKRHENAKGDNSHHIPDTLLKKLTMGTWLGKSMLIDCSSSKVISKYVLLYENGLYDGIFSRVLRRLYPDGSQDCSHAHGTFSADGLRADVRTGRMVWFLQQITDTTVSASVLSKDTGNPGLLSGGVMVQTAPGFVVQTRHVTMGTIMNVEHTLLRRIDNVNTWYESHTEVPDFDMGLYQDEMDTFLTASAPWHPPTKEKEGDGESSVEGESES